jgi:hypothetical protein
MLSVVVSLQTLTVSFAECHYAECHYAECHNAGCRYVAYVRHSYVIKPTTCLLLVALSNYASILYRLLSQKHPSFFPESFTLVGKISDESWRVLLHKHKCLYYITIIRVTSFKLSLLPKIDLQNTQTLPVNNIGNYLQK